MNDSGNPIQAVTDDQIRSALERLRRDRQLFSTVDVIRAILGFYHRDVGVRGASPNGMFGKRLMKYAHEFGIVRVPPDRPVDDGEGGTTTAAMWRPAP
jgi:LPS sulfotransferase NodH